MRCLLNCVCLITLTAMPSASNVAKAADASDAAWLQFATADIVFYTDAPLETAQGLFAALNAQRALTLHTLALENLQQFQPAKVVLFSKRADFVRFTGRRRVTGFFLPEWREQLVVAGPYRGDTDAVQVLLHEYVHFMVKNSVHRTAPIWFEEGLAELLSTATFADGHVTLGHPPRRALKLGPQRVQIRRLLRAEKPWPAPDTQRYYAQSWTLVHRLVQHTAMAERRQLLSQLANRDTGREALTEAVSNLARAGPQTWRQTLDIAPAAEPVVTRLDAPARAQLLGYLAVRSRPKLAAKIFEAVLRDDPEHPRATAGLAVALQMRGRFERSLPLARKALAADPDDALLHTELADMLEVACEETARTVHCEAWRNESVALRKGAHSLADSLETQAMLGYTLLETGHPARALPFLTQAFERGSWSADIAYHVARCYADLGDVRNATTWLDRASDIAHPESDLIGSIATERAKLSS